MQSSEGYARFCSAGSYGEIACKHLATMEQCLKDIVDISKGEELDFDDFDGPIQEVLALEKSCSEAAAIAIVFAGMAVEAYIYDYSARNLGDKFTKDHLDSLSVQNKWVLIPRLITGTDFPKDRAAFSLLNKLVKSRNNLVHSKSKAVCQTDLASGEIEKRQNAIYSNARDAVRALRELADQIKLLDPNELAHLNLGAKTRP